MHVGVKRVKEAKVQTLKTEFEAIRMKDGKSIDDFSMKLMTIVSGIRSLDDVVEEISVVKKFLQVVPQRFMQIVTSIEHFGDLKNMSVEKVVGHLKVHEERLRGYEGKEEKKYLLLTNEEWLARTKRKDADDSSFLSSSGHGSHNKEKRGHGCGRKRGGKGGHENISQTHENVNTWKDKSMIKCNSCRKYGHYAAECRSKKQDEEATLTLTQDQEPTLMLAEMMPKLLMLNEEKIMANLLTKREDQVETSMWYLDNGASNHMTRD